MQTQQFPGRLQAAMAQSGKTHAEIARAAEMNWAQLYKLVRGHRPHVQADTLARVAVALGVSMDWLAGLTDTPQPYPRSKTALQIS